MRGPAVPTPQTTQPPLRLEALAQFMGFLTSMPEPQKVASALTRGPLANFGARASRIMIAVDNSKLVLVSQYGHTPEEESRYREISLDMDVPFTRAHRNWHGADAPHGRLGHRSHADCISGGRSCGLRRVRRAGHPQHSREGCGCLRRIRRHAASARDRAGGRRGHIRVGVAVAVATMLAASFASASTLTVHGSPPVEIIPSSIELVGATPTPSANPVDPVEPSSPTEPEPTPPSDPATTDASTPDAIPTPTPTATA